MPIPTKWLSQTVLEPHGPEKKSLNFERLTLAYEQVQVPVAAASLAKRIAHSFVIKFKGTQCRPWQENSLI